MKLIKQLLYLLPVSVLVVLSCNKEMEKRGPVSNDPAVPAQVSDVKVENGNGKATITYKLPNDPKLLYVKAVYTITTGQQYEAKASYYGNSLVVEGFADTLEHEVKLYSVSRSEVASAPVSVTVKPLIAPIWQVYRSLELREAFGGYNLTAMNPSEANVAVLVTKPNVFNEYEVDNDRSVYSNADTIISQVRGLDTLNYRWGFVIRDRWGNKTDTMYRTFKPLYETQLDPTKFRAYTLPGDASQVTNGAALVYAWDNRLGWPYTSFTNQSSVAGPHMITFDLGVTAQLSRIWIRPFPEGTRYYYLTTMKRFEIYGSQNPSLSGALDASWTLLGSYTVNKPSGLPYGTDNALDQATAAAGFNWDIPLTMPRVRYIRIRSLENFAGGTAQSINELKVYGDPR